MLLCLVVACGCMINLDAVLDFSDALVFIIALPNILGLYILAPVIKKELASYQLRLKNGSITNLRVKND